MHEACVHHARCVAFAPQDVANTKLFKPCLDMPWLWLALPFPLDLRLWLALPLYTFGFCLRRLAVPCLCSHSGHSDKVTCLRELTMPCQQNFSKLAVPKMWLPSYSSHALPSLTCGDHDVA
ncbi:hypothetical protein GBA52_024603 [Prunus armeniaca]|nr:hypothetical protein GBA52_024603 [Prunus armeniaca]